MTPSRPAYVTMARVTRLAYAGIFFLAACALLLIAALYGYTLFFAFQLWAFPQ